MQLNIYGVIVFIIGVLFTIIFFLSKKDFYKAFGILSGLASIIGLIFAIVDSKQVTDTKPVKQSYDTVRLLDPQPVSSPVSQNSSQNISQNSSQNISQNSSQNISQNSSQNISIINSNNNGVIVIGDNNNVENNYTQYNAQNNLQSATQSTKQNEKTIISPPDSNDNIVIKKVNVDNDNIVVNLKFMHYVSGKVKVFISEDDICTLENANDFPKELVGNKPTFSVKLKLKGKANRTGKESISRFTVQLDKNYYEGTYSEVKKIDLSQYYDDL